MSLEAAEQIANMMVMEPYPGFEGRSFKFPCRNVVPKPVQKPHPPMWMACTNRDTIKIAASHGLGALAFSFLDEAEARTWSQIYYDIIRSEACVPLGHSVNANIAMVSAFSLHAGQGRGGAPRAGRLRVLPLCHQRARHRRHGARPLAAVGGVPGQACERGAGCDLRGDPRPRRRLPSLARHRHAGRLCRPRALLRGGRRRPDHPAAAGRPQCARRHLRLPRAVRARGAAAVQGQGGGARAAKAEELAPFIAKALARKKEMAPLGDADIPVVRASVAKPAVNTACSVRCSRIRTIRGRASPRRQWRWSFDGLALSRHRRQAVVEHDHVALHHAGAERDALAVGPHLRADGLAGKHRRGEAHLQVFSRAGSLPQQALTMARPATP